MSCVNSPLGLPIHGTQVASNRSAHINPQLVVGAGREEASADRRGQIPTLPSSADPRVAGDVPGLQVDLPEQSFDLQIRGRAIDSPAVMTRKTSSQSSTDSRQILPPTRAKPGAGFSVASPSIARSNQIVAG